MKYYKKLFKMVSWVSIIYLIVFCNALYGEEIKDKDIKKRVTMQGITVLGKKKDSAEQSLNLIDITKEKRGVVSTVPDLLEDVSGVDVQRRSILTPKSSQIKLRGFDEKRYLVLLNGRTLNGAGVMGGYFVDWSMLPIEDFKYIEVSKGAYSARYGNTLGGYINLVSPDIITNEIYLTAGYKRYETYSVTGGGSFRHSNIGIRLISGYYSTNGYLRNSEAQRANFLGDVYYFFKDNGHIKLSVLYSKGDFQMPVKNKKDKVGFDSHYPESTGTYLAGPGIKFKNGDTNGDNSFYRKKRTQIDISLKKKISGFDTDIAFYWNNEDREDTIYSYVEGKKILEREATPDRSYGWHATFGYFLNDHHITFGGEGNYQGYGGTENTFVSSEYFYRPPIDGSDEWDASRYHGIYIDDTYQLNKNLSVYLGLRYENYRADQSVDQVTGYNSFGRPIGWKKVDKIFDESVFLPKFGLSLDLNKYISLYLHIAKAARFPDNPAFYWYYAGYRPEIDPNSNIVRKDLTYEDAMEYEFGLKTNLLERVYIKFSLFNYIVDDYIRWIFGYPPSRVVYNIDKVKINGLEMDSNIELMRYLYLFGNFTWQDSKKTGDVLDASNELTDELSELPEWKFNVGIKYERPDGALIKTTIHWVDKREVPYLKGAATPLGSPDGTPLGRPVVLKKLRSYSVVNALVKYPILKHRIKGFLTMGVENLFDKNYEEELDFPAPERTFYLTFEIKF